ncbi:MAG: phosphate acyltransferase PlsX [Candidatus Bipolaricaulia bacterium]
MRIILDTLGGDNPPEEIIRGGVAAAKRYEGIEVALAGRSEQIKPELERCDQSVTDRLSIIEAPEEISMFEPPVRAVKNKTNSSLVRGIEALKEEAPGQGDALVSPGNTGAVMAAALLKLGRIRGITRPGIAAALPTLKQETLVIDVGANTDCSPENLKQFAIMGQVYAREIMEIEDPRVGLLNIGEEQGKGSELTINTYTLLKESSLNFVGNVESHSLITGREVDVVVCDGFVGNVLLKAYEGGAEAVLKLLKRSIERDLWSRIGGLILEPTLRNFIREMSSSHYGGAPLLGVKGIVIIAHGHADAVAIENAIGVAQSSVVQRLIEKIQRGIEAELKEE